MLIIFKCLIFVDFVSPNGKFYKPSNSLIEFFEFVQKDSENDGLKIER